MFHYTDKTSYNSIRASIDWRFKAHQPPGDHPFGAYFTTLGPGTKNLAIRLRIPKSKICYVFAFIDLGDLTPWRGGRGEYIYYSSSDYEVKKSDQLFCGECTSVLKSYGDIGGDP